MADGYDEREVINNPVNARNIMYTFHFYAASDGDDVLKVLSRAADKLPMFVSEFGTQRYTGNDINNFVQSQKYLDMMARKKIGWVNWNFSDEVSSGAIFVPDTCPSGNFSGISALKPAGKWIRAHLRTPDQFSQAAVE